MDNVEEYFFGLTLKGAKVSIEWDPNLETNPYPGDHKLVLKQALVGHKAPDGEVNVVEVEAFTWKGTVRIPIAFLKAGGINNQVLLDSTFKAPVTFSLVKGSGPVHILGQHLVNMKTEEVDEMDEQEKEEMIEDEEGYEGAQEDDEDDEPKRKKAKTADSSKDKIHAKQSKRKSKANK